MLFSTVYYYDHQKHAGIYISVHFLDTFYPFELVSIKHEPHLMAFKFKDKELIWNVVWQYSKQLVFYSDGMNSYVDDKPNENAFFCFVSGAIKLMSQI